MGPSLHDVHFQTVYCKLATPHIYNYEAGTNWLELAEYQVDEQQRGGGQTGRVKDMVCPLDDIYMNSPSILTG